MPLTPHARHWRNLAALDRRVRRRLYPNTVDTAPALGVCSRTVHRYVAFLRSELGAPLAFDRRRGGFYYAARWDFGKALLAWLARED
jgi:hypothetical protein